jgi:hypothetical protein
MKPSQFYGLQAYIALVALLLESDDVGYLYLWVFFGMNAIAAFFKKRNGN